MNKYFALGILFFSIYNVIFFLFFFHVLSFYKEGIIATGILGGIGASSAIAGLAFLMLGLGTSDN